MASLNQPEADPFTEAVPEKHFIITLANADRSTGGIMQIGCRTWPVVDYQNMVTRQLYDGRTSTEGLVDQNGVSLVLTLHDIMSEDPSYCPGGANSSIGREVAIARGLSPVPTIRVGFGARSILDGGIHPTRAQCVLGLHDPDDAVCFSDQAVLSNAETVLAAGTPDPSYSYASCVNMNINEPPPAGYIRDPARQLHITESMRSENAGFRWRNGALTVQLLDAEIDPTTDLQPAATMVRGAGTHAKAYSVTYVGRTPVIAATEDQESGEFDESGLLYEAAIFWHYSALVDDLRNSDPDSSSTPKDAPCYGGGAYSGRTVIDEGGLTLGEYQALTNPLVEECEALAESDPEATCDLNRFFQLLELIDTAESESDLNQFLLQLAALLDGNAALKAYAEKRDYIGDKIPEQNKLEGDKSQGDDDDLQNDPGDGTPAQVTTIETIDLEARGPNFVFGRRNWIDIKH